MAPLSEEESAHGSSLGPQASGDRPPVARGPAKHIYGASELPPISAPDAFYRRLLFVPFPNRLPPEDRGPDTAQQLKKEQDGILQWAIEGLHRLIEQGGFSVGRSPKVTRQWWEALGGPIRRYKTGVLEVTGEPDDVVRKEQLYQAFKSYCREERISIPTKQEFTETLTEDPQIEASRRTPEPGADQVPCYVGVRSRAS
jgi:phage/plasmid-associated DNA primase